MTRSQIASQIAFHLATSSTTSVIDAVFVKLISLKRMSTIIEGIRIRQTVKIMRLNFCKIRKYKDSISRYANIPFARVYTVWILPKFVLSLKSMAAIEVALWLFTLTLTNKLCCFVFFTYTSCSYFAYSFFHCIPNILSTVFDFWLTLSRNGWPKWFFTENGVNAIVWRCMQHIGWICLKVQNINDERWDLNQCFYSYFTLVYSWQWTNQPWTWTVLFDYQSLVCTTTYLVIESKFITNDVLYLFRHFPFSDQRSKNWLVKYNIKKAVQHPIDIIVKSINRWNALSWKVCFNANDHIVHI